MLSSEFAQASAVNGAFHPVMYRLLKYSKPQFNQIPTVRPSKAQVLHTVVYLRLNLR